MSLFRRIRQPALPWGILALTAIVLPAGARGQAPAPDPLTPDSVLSPPGFPTIVRLPGASPGVLTLRLSVPLVETPSEAGAGSLLRALAADRMAGPAETLGARVETGRTPWGLAYTVSGPAADLDYLIYLLREATRAPAGDDAALSQERLAMDEALRRLEETGGGRIEAALRAGAAPDHPPAEGTRGSVPGLGPSLLQDVWARSHRADSMTLIVLGDVADPVLLASLAGLGAGPDVVALPPRSGPAPAAPSPGRVQTLRRWYGLAWSSAAPLDPRAAVTAVLLARHLRQDADAYEAEVRLWETEDRTVLGVVGAAYPAQFGALRTRLDGLLTATSAELEPGEVRDAAARARRDLLLQARTPWGRAHLVGRFLDAGLGPGGARAYLAQLADLDREAIQGFLATLASQTPVRAEVRP